MGTVLTSTLCKVGRLVMGSAKSGSVLSDITNCESEALGIFISDELRTSRSK